MPSPTSVADPAVEQLRSLATAYARHDPVRTVAVLGNAPMPPSEQRADEIDASDLVLRVNSFVLDEPGAPRCQGSRVDVVIWNRITRATPYLFADYSDRLYLLVEPMRLHGFGAVWPPSWPEDLGLVPVPNDAVTVPLCETLGIPWKEERLAPTTGTMAVHLAVLMFPEADIRVAGLSFVDDPHQTQWRHQWGDSCPVGREHRLVSESRLLRGYLAEGRIQALT